MPAFGDSDFFEHLSGRAFVADCHVRYRLQRSRQSRLDALRAACAGRRVLHIGCCDHPPLLRQKLADGEWAHALLTEASAECLGIDIDPAAVAETRHATGMDNIVAGDITRPGLEAIGSRAWDLAVFGEVLEHVGNPVAFLQGFARHYGAVASRILVTVPNARKLRNLADSLRQLERINSDHRFDFTPYTLAKVLYDGGYRIDSLSIVPEGRPGPLKSLLQALFPLTGDILLAAASLHGDGLHGDGPRGEMAPD